MGGKLSNSSGNSKAFPTYHTPLVSDYSIRRHSNGSDQNHASDIPSIVVDFSSDQPHSYQRRYDNNSEFRNYLPPKMAASSIDDDRHSADGEEPQIFPKIANDPKSAPVTNTNWFRIHPIKQKGVKLSDTHYWIINEPKHKRCHSARVKRNPPEMYVNAKTFAALDPYEEPDLPYDLNEQISHEYARTRPVKRGKSESGKSYLYNMHRGLVIRMMFKIPAASEMECNSVLIGANWDFNVAEKRLKVDLLHRQGLVNQQRCAQLLEQCAWDLDQAQFQSEKEFRLMQLENSQQSRNGATRTHFSYDTG